MIGKQAPPAGSHDGASEAMKVALSTSTKVDVREAKARPRPLRTIFSILGAFLLVYAVIWGVRQPKFDWGVVGHYMFSAEVLKGLWATLYLAFFIELVACLLGGITAAMRLSSYAPARWAAAGYVWVIRSVPPLVQIIFWFNLAYLVPRLSIGIPFGGPSFLHVSTNSAISPLAAGLLGLGLFSSGYQAEIIRAGILSVDRGQYDAARSLGLRPLRIMYKVVLPQAMRVILPPTGNLAIMIVQGTSLLSAITVGELLLSVQNIYQTNFKIVPLLIVATIWYVIVIAIMSIVQARLERRFNRGRRPQNLPNVGKQIWSFRRGDSNDINEEPA